MRKYEKFILWFNRNIIPNDLFIHRNRETRRLCGAWKCDVVVSIVTKLLQTILLILVNFFLFSSCLRVNKDDANKTVTPTQDYNNNFLLKPIRETHKNDSTGVVMKKNVRMVKWVSIKINKVLFSIFLTFACYLNFGQFEIC